MNDFWGRILGCLIELPLHYIPPVDTDHIFSGYKEDEPGYVWSCVHGHCDNASGYEWTMNAPVIWVFGRLMSVPMAFLAAVMCVPFFIVLGTICWIGELLGKERGWFL